MKLRKLSRKEFPPRLLEIPDAPDKLYLLGNMPPEDAKMLCVVGARRNTEYGREVCEKLVSSLKGKNVAIVSGLALGIDTIAHKAALASGLFTLSAPGSGLNDKVLYPHTNLSFSKKIIESGGGLISEFEPDFKSTQWAFPMRNRIMAGLSQAVLIIEAERKSGTLITARLAADYNRDVLVVPGSIASRNSEGPHLLLRIGATPITCPQDLHEALGFEATPATTEERYGDCGAEERKIIELLENPMSRDDLIRNLEMPASEINMHLSLLEMKGHIQEFMGELRLKI